MTQQRLFAHIMRSLAAIGLLITLVAGTPLALAVAVGWPLPHAIPHIGEIRSTLSAQSIDDAFIVKAIAVVCWLAWTQFVACIAVEIVGWRRGRAARHVPLGSVMQPLVAQLVMAASLLVNMTSRASAPSPVLLSPTPSVYIVHDEPTATADAPPKASAQPEVAAAPKTYVVKPRDDLWSLAEVHLGNGYRWRELFEFNQGRPQPNGGALRRPNLIRPGWILHFPADAVGLDNTTATVATDPCTNNLATATADPIVTPGPATSEPPPGQTQTASACPDPSPSPGVAAAPQTAFPAPPITPDGETPGVSPSAPPNPPPPEPEQSSTPNDHEDHGAPAPGLPVGILGATLLAAGVVTTIDRLRRVQQRRRPPNRAVRMPAVTAIPTEIAVRRAAASSPANRLDLTLRTFASRAAQGRGGNAPSVSAVQVATDGIEILLTEPFPAEPGPFSVSAAGQVWTLPAAVPDAALENQTAEIGAPLPALVSIGTLGDSTVLIDLESTGCTALTGRKDVAATAFRAMALELATSLWADALDVIIVATDAEVFQTLERVRVATTLLEILPDVEAAAAALNDALSGASASTTLGARLGTTAADGWAPTVVLCADPGSDPESFSRLVALAGAGARGLAVVTIGEVTGADRLLRFDDRTVEVTPPGVTLTVTGPTSKQVTDVEKILAAASDCDGVETGAEPTAADSQSAGGFVLNAPHSEHDFDVLVRLLGPVEIEGGKQPIDRRKAVELVVYLATHPKGLDDDRLKTALWPEERAPQASFNTTVTRARSRLGTAADGSYYLPHLAATGGLYRLSPRVTTDFDLLERHLVTARTAAPEAATRSLKVALELVRGLALTGVRQGYEWAYAEGIVARMETIVAEAAHHLAQLALEARDSDLAQWAARQGLLASPGDEVLYRDRMLACDLAGNPAGVEAVMDELIAAVEAIEPYDTLHPETVALYERLSHRRRRTG